MAPIHNPDINVSMTPDDNEAEDSSLTVLSILGKPAKSDKNVTIDSMTGERTSWEHGANVELSVEQREEYLSQSNLSAPAVLNDTAMAAQGISIHSIQNEDVEIAAKLSILTTTDVPLDSSVSIPCAQAEQEMDEVGVTLELSRNMVPQEDDVTLEQRKRLQQRHKESITADPVMNGLLEPDDSYTVEPKNTAPLQDDDVTLEQRKRLQQRHKESITADPRTNDLLEPDDSYTVEPKSTAPLQDDDVIIPFIPSRHGSLKSDMSLPHLTIDVTDVGQAS